MNFIDLLQLFAASVAILAMLRIIVDAVKEEN
jgi:hypothetical protein